MENTMPFINVNDEELFYAETSSPDARLTMVLVHGALFGPFVSLHAGIDMRAVCAYTADGKVTHRLQVGQVRIGTSQARE